MKTPRQNDLAKIHIARKALSIDEDIYRDMVRTVGGCPSGSSADLSATGRSKILERFKQLGWKPVKKSKLTHIKGQPKPISKPQLKLIEHIWIRLVEAGVITSQDKSALRAWVQHSTRRFHPQKVGYAAPEFMPSSVAREVIEMLKKMADRNNVTWGKKE